MKKLSALLVSTFLLLGGCQTIVGDDRENPNVKEPSETGGGEDDRYISVNEYTGEGYRLNGGKANDKIAQEKFDEIEAGVKAFFLDKYKTDVIVHNAVGNVDGATVFVESEGEPHFYTKAIVPFNIETGNVQPDEIWTLEKEVEKSIATGLLAMVMEEEFNKLDAYLDTFVERNNLAGFTMEAIENIMATSYTTPYYFVQATGENRDQLVEVYLNNPDITPEELRGNEEFINYDPKEVLFSINLFMGEESEPDQEVFDTLVEDMESMEGLPRGTYSVSLNDHLCISALELVLKTTH